MSRYIDVDALIEELESCSNEVWSKGVNRAWWAQAVNVKDNIKRCIERQPTADVVEVMHGEWNTTDTILGRCCVCSVCGSCPTMKYKYCPYCGAKMDGNRRSGN